MPTFAFYHAYGRFRWPTTLILVLPSHSIFTYSQNECVELSMAFMTTVHLKLLTSPIINALVRWTWCVILNVPQCLLCTCSRYGILNLGTCLPLPHGTHLDPKPYWSISKQHYLVLLKDLEYWRNMNFIGCCWILLGHSQRRRHLVSNLLDDPQDIGWVCSSMGTCRPPCIVIVWHTPHAPHQTP